VVRRFSIALDLALRSFVLKVSADRPDARYVETIPSLRVSKEEKRPQVEARRARRNNQKIRTDPLKFV